MSVRCRLQDQFEVVMCHEGDDAFKTSGTERMTEVEDWKVFEGEGGELCGVTQDLTCGCGCKLRNQIKTAWASIETQD
jgi:hypothetical protein